MTHGRGIHARSSAASRKALIARRMFDGFALRDAGALVIEGERIAALETGDAAPPDADVIRLPDDWLLAPGLVDWQVNGGGGVLLNHNPTRAGAAAIVAAHRAHGTTSIAPTLITDAAHVMAALLKEAPWSIPGVASLHLEGPFIDMARRGVHPARHVRAITQDDLALLVAASAKGRLLVTLAPEHAPAGAIATLASAGIIVSLGHSAASGREAVAAANAGATGVTHLFNAMSQLTARKPGLVGAALADERLAPAIIADGLHVDPLSLRVALAAAGPQRLMLVSDAMASVGALEPAFDLFGERVGLCAGRLTTPAGVLAGAHLTMLEAVRRMVSLAGAPLQDALQMATSTPARFLRCADDIGSLRPGAFADLIVLDADLRLRAAFFRGHPVDDLVPALDEESRG